MNVAVAFKHVDHSDALEFYINQKSDSLKKLLWNGEHFDWVIEDDADEFKININMKLRNKKLSVSSKGENPFSVASKVIDKAKRLVREDHQRLRVLH